MSQFSRRRALQILAASVAVPLGALGLRGLRGELHPVSWKGEALGGLASLTLWSYDPDHATAALVRMQAELRRLEKVFSLYDATSEIVRLNRNQVLSDPSMDLFRVLEEARRVADLSQGAFDPSIQPLWRLHAKTLKPDPSLISAAIGAVDYSAIAANRKSIKLEKNGMAITLNGIAQGYITDRVTEVLGNEGFENAVIQLGETRALGHAPDGAPFTIALVDPLNPDRLKGELEIAGNAISVSGGYGHQFSSADSHHIFDPTTGKSANRLLQVVVRARTATLADALSTAIYVAGEHHAARILGASPDSLGILTRPNGTTITL